MEAYRTKGTACAKARRHERARQLPSANTACISEGAKDYW